MRYTVFGATGGTGRQLVWQALDAGHEVTAVVRDPDRLPVRHGRLDVVTAPVTDADALRPLVAGRDAVLSSLGSPTNKGAGIASAGTRAILRAQEKEGVLRYVGVSAAPVGEWPDGETVAFRTVVGPAVRWAFRHVYADLAVMEEEIRTSAVDWTIVRPPQLTDGPLTSTYERRIGGAVPRNRRIPRADLAYALLEMAGDPEVVGKVVGVAAGPA